MKSKSSKMAGIFLTFFIIGISIIFCTKEEKVVYEPAEGRLMTKWAKEITPDNVLPEYPRPQMVRYEWKNLNGLWQFASAKDFENTPVGKNLRDNIMVPFPVESALSGIMKHTDRCWYRRKFEIPKNWKDKRILLHFGAVDWESTVYVNGKNMGTHRGGYDSFTYDITDVLKSKGKQELIVKVFDPTDKGEQPRGKQVLEPRGIWYTPVTGIWQTVWLEPVNETRIKNLFIIPDIDREKIKLKVITQNTTNQHKIKASIYDKNTEIAQISGTPDETLEISVKNPKLWSPDNPFLYDLKIILSEKSKTIDEVKSYFGMRKISSGKDKSGKTRILFNNKFVFQIGPLDQGFWPDGIYTAPTEKALRYDIEVTKKLGFNMTRKHVKIEPERWYYWCDKLGLIVWQDMPSGTNKTPEGRKQFELELKEMINQYYNHPSIVMWVVFNEGWGQYDTDRLVKMVKELDPTRLVNNASGWDDKGFGDVHDIHRYPGPAATEPEPERAAVLGEFGGIGLKIDEHTWKKSGWGYRGAANKNHLTYRYQKLLKELYEYKKSPGMSAGVYTQITDVETELNGLMTYDREVIKPDIEKVKAANNGDFSTMPDIKAIVPSSLKEAFPWKYTFNKPDSNWYEPDFDDQAWNAGKAGFGTKTTPGSAVRTEWNTKNIWLRREFYLKENEFNNPHFYIHNDESAEIYINGVLALKIGRHTTDYEEYPVYDKAVTSLKSGKNVIAVHCRNSGGAQYIDVGILDLVY